ncbi:uncharacterized protein LOC100898605 [Galendromus occidentalis]|uniref:Uncharacterized protein LOC100898605 n=1 Tax=Galendromus occidentalis TaxID=34638 RepID=A0AAJ6QQY7_9ACAR|nr:uncharacterized protein LOC100898605 [Galendromus occidentalis]
MRRIIALAMLIAIVLPPACESTVGILPLAAMGVVGFKVYLGMRLLGSSAISLQSYLPTLSSLHGYDIFDGEDVDDSDDEDDDQEKSSKKARRIQKRAVDSIYNRAFPRLNPEILKFIHQIDDDQCFEKFVCQLGADRKAFGKLGMNVALMLEFYSSDPNSWYNTAMHKGRKLGKKDLCPGRCESEDIKKVVNYVSKELFSGYTE